MSQTTCRECGNPSRSNPCPECVDDHQPITPALFVRILTDLLEGEGDHGAFEDAGGIRSAIDFGDGSVLTSNAGLTVTLGDGSEYQLSIVQSAWAGGRR